MAKTTHVINGIFPSPVYSVKRDVDISPKEEKEVKEIIEEGLEPNVGNFMTTNTYVFNDRLHNIKQFCETQLRGYVKAIINPEKDIEVYITQSWLNVTKPDGFHHEHRHSNSLLSGVFYISTEEGDNTTFANPNGNEAAGAGFTIWNIPQKEPNVWGSATMLFPVANNELNIFPSWLPHRTMPNDNATKDRISLSFNTFIRGHLGLAKDLTELIL
jgi:uncharacterized protein (TIGR02466 family)